ncbi:autotransporter domain-containing protein, partial [Rahnella bruchi]
VDPVDPVIPVDPVNPVDPTEPAEPQPTFVVLPANIHAYDPQMLAIGLQKPTTRSLQQVDWALNPITKSACNISGECFSDDAMWITPHTSKGSGNSALDADITGISVGGYIEGLDSRVGLSVDYSDFDLSTDGASSSSSRYAVNAFASERFEDFVLSGSLGYTHAPVDTTRQVTSSGITLGEGKSTFSSEAISTALSVSWPLALGETKIVPQIGIDTLNVHYSGFDESMSADKEIFRSVIGKMKVRGDSDNYQSVQPNVGISIYNTFTVAGKEVTPNLNLTYRRELMDDNSSTVYSNDGTEFGVAGNTLGRDIAEYSLGVDVKLTPNLHTMLSYTGSWQQGYQSQEGMIQVKYKF